MLSLLRVQNLAVIDTCEVEFGPGLNVVTGETGAGKSILVGALRLVLGARGRPELVRTGAAQAEIEALFELEADSLVRRRLAELGFEDGDELLVRRVVQANGRSRAYVNGRLSTARQLVALAQGLVDISSQHQHHTLVDPATHLGFLDAFAELRGRRADMATAHAALLSATAGLRSARQTLRERTEREDLLRFQLDEIGRLDPEPGELADLEAQRDRLVHAERLLQAVGRAEELLYSGERAVCGSLDRIVGGLVDVARYDVALDELAERVSGAATELEEVGRDLGSYLSDAGAEPGRLEVVEERLHELRRLVRRHGSEVRDVLAFADRARADLGELDQAEGRITALKGAQQAGLSHAQEAARALSVARHAAAGRLAEAMTAELAELGMGLARVEVAVAPLDGGDGEMVVDGARLSATGRDRAEFLIAPNPGEAPRPLRKVASGGELSRALLALKRVLAQGGPVGLYVFDEVDTGVGGGIAEVIGRKLAQVAAHHQVLCITHLPQVAIYGDRHLAVTKRVDDGRTYSDIVTLGPSARREEIARMLGGLEITPATRHLAAELLRQRAAAG